MKDVIITKEIISQKVSEKLPEIIAELMNSDYDSPIKSVVKEELEKKDGIIRELVRSLLTEVMEDDTFKEELRKAIIGRIIETGLTNQ